MVVVAAASARALDGGDTIATLAGGGNGDGFAPQVAAVQPDTVSVGPDGSIYIAESEHHRIRRIDPQSGTIETFAGIGAEGFAGDGGPATRARLRYPTHAVADSAGNVYIADQSNHRIRRVSPNGIITTVAGTGFTGAVDGHATTVARLYFPRSLAVDVDGNVLIAEPFNQRIRFLRVAEATVSTVAGTGTGGFSGDNGQATAAKLQLPAGVWSLGRNTFLIADQANHRVRRVDSNGIIRTVAGTGVNGFSGDNGAATGAKLSNPVSVSARSDGSFLIADQGNNRVRRVTASGTIQTIAGTGSAGYNGDGFSAAQAQLNRPSGVAYDAQGNCLIADMANERVRRIGGCSATAPITTLAGIDDAFTGDDWPALAAVLEGPADVVQDARGNIFLADAGANRVRMIDTDGIIHTYAGTGAPGFSGDGGPATNAALRQPNRVAIAANGDLLILDTGNRRVRRVNAGSRTITTVAGNGEWGSGGDGGLATHASFKFPLGLATDPTGRIYVADAEARNVRVVDSDGRIFTYAGTGVATNSLDGPGGNPADNLGDFGPAHAASFISPADLVVDDAGTLYIADMSAHRVRKIDANGTIRPVTGTGIGTGRIDGQGGNPDDDLGDGGPASEATVNSPIGLDLTADGMLLIADQVNRRIRIVEGGRIRTLGGNGYVTWSVDGEGGAAHDDLGDGGIVAAATFNTLSSVFVDSIGNLLLTDSQARRLRLIVSAAPNQPPPSSTPTPSYTPTALPTQVPWTPTRTRTPTRTPTGTPPASNGGIGGTISYYANSQPISGVTIDLLGPLSITTLSGSSGQYSATVPLGVWSVQPRKLRGFGSAVSSLDASRVLQAIAGLLQAPFTDDQLLACDVTGDGSLSTLDAVHILQFSAGVIGRLPVADACDSDWLFKPTATGGLGALLQPVVGGTNCQQGSIILNPLTGFIGGQNFTGILFGDCTGNWSSGMALRRQAAGDAIVEAGRARRTRNGVYRVPVRVRSATPYQALDLVLQHAPGARFRGVTARGVARDALIGTQAEDGLVTIAVANATPITRQRATLLLLEFEGADPELVLGGAQVDEAPARVKTRTRRAR